MRPCDICIKKTLNLVKDMIVLADEGDAVREDINCGILYSVLRDSAYRLKIMAESERKAHKLKGWWNE